jgi:hypothetical protein
MVLKAFCTTFLVVLARALPRPDGYQVQDDIAPKRQEQKSDHPIPGVKRVKIRTGPYTVPNMQVMSTCHNCITSAFLTVHERYPASPQEYME